MTTVEQEFIVAKDSSFFFVDGQGVEIGAEETADSCHR